MTVNTYFITLASCSIAYFAGSIPFGLLLGKLFGVGDIRAIGSGNIGATNMLRTGRKGLALATLILDFGKGVIGVAAAQGFCDYFFIHPGDFVIHPDIRWLAGIAAVMGHIFPIWLKFKGGKGVATTLGVYFAIDPVMGILTALGWLIMFYLTRVSSLAAMGSLATSPVLAFRYSKVPYFSVTALVLTIIVIAKHKDNIVRIRAGNEKKWEKKNDPS